jgi:predicted Fe-S protein YdhL (DUF1289 family)
MLPSPCINICKMNAASGLCLGCFRTLDEIAGWARADEATQAAILAAVERRRQQHDPQSVQASGDGDR